MQSGFRVKISKESEFIRKEKYIEVYEVKGAYDRGIDVSGPWTSSMIFTSKF